MNLFVLIVLLDIDHDISEPHHSSMHCTSSLPATPNTHRGGYLHSERSDTAPDLPSL